MCILDGKRKCITCHEKHIFSSREKTFSSQARKPTRNYFYLCAAFYNPYGVKVKVDFGLWVVDKELKV